MNKNNLLLMLDIKKYILILHREKIKGYTSCQEV